MSALRNLRDQRFGRLTALSLFGRSRSGKAIWFCRCDCGTETRVISGNLVSGISRSCGCLAREIASEYVTARNWKHGHTSRAGISSEYQSWSSMHQRCSYPCVNDYAIYGGRGIQVCARWSSFEAFLQDMGLKPTPQHTIDRKDGDGNYEPNNCRWATKSEQALNRRCRGKPMVEDCMLFEDGAQ